MSATLRRLSKLENKLNGKGGLPTRVFRIVSGGQSDDEIHGWLSDQGYQFNPHSDRLINRRLAVVGERGPLVSKSSLKLLSVSEAV
ncbi:hypothetical protein [Labrenzia sp. DG1229]|uniref:hypothetical protein n=1 Tax=Labrenzia sp. DG1229 TaxID=681847 RepID=UPI00048D68D8|nr:hypothetical protein [Labrenzia sp. DG1229]